ncbi:MAG TPA: hypothetical protein VHL78_10960 [Actinomycetota bacterium]|nr:hypothetical protein [Actinomycetota bacterium]
MASKRRGMWWLIGGLAAVGFTALVAVAAYSPPPRLAPDDVADESDRPRGEENIADDRVPPGVEPGRGGPRDEPVALDGAMESAVLNPDGSVTASGYLVCTPGETMNVGWAIWNVRSDRGGGIVRTGVDRLYYECTGERQEWTLRGDQILNGGIDAGSHPYTVKTAVGTGSRHDHRDYFQGTIVVEG